LVVSLFPRH